MSAPSEQSDFGLYSNRVPYELSALGIYSNSVSYEQSDLHSSDCS